MILNIDADIDEQMKKINELIVKYQQLEEHTKKIHFVTIKEFSKMRRLLNKGCSRYF